MATEIIAAKTAGFCFGVRRAVDMAFRESAANGRVWSAGPLIHNDTVLHRLEAAGVGLLQEGQTLSRCDYHLTAGWFQLPRQNF